eukprot:4557954-Pyramimonas_sp.AAC.1
MAAMWCRPNAMSRTHRRTYSKCQIRECKKHIWLHRSGSWMAHGLRWLNDVVQLHVGVEAEKDTDMSGQRMFAMFASDIDVLGSPCATACSPVAGTSKCKCLMPWLDEARRPSQGRSPKFQVDQ